MAMPLIRSAISARRRFNQSRSVRRSTHGLLEFEQLESRRLLTATVDLASFEQNLTVYGAGNAEQIAVNGALISGDFNGDGIDDVVFGTPNDDGPNDSRINSGAVFILFGSANVSWIRDLAGDKGAVPDVAIFGAEDADFLFEGPKLAAGDLNGDGITDLIIGAPFADGPGNSRHDAGEVYIIFGGASLPSTIDLANQEADVQIFGAIGDSRGDRLTEEGVLATGDLNGDGIDDLLIGSSEADGPSESRNDAGEAYIIYGSTNLSAMIDLELGEQNVTIYGANYRLAAGNTTAFGDVNGDGISDLMIGALYGDGPSGDTRGGAGEVNIIFGSHSLPSIIDLASDDQDAIILGADAVDFLSFSGLQVGDVSGDGIDDIVVSAGRGDGPGNSRPDAGEAYVILGKTSFPGIIDLKLGQQDVLIYGASNSDQLGVLALGDLNGDGINDVVLHSSFADGPSESRATAGEAYIVFGSTSFSPVVDLANHDEDVIVYGASADDRLTRDKAFAIADFNGDGVLDLALGSSQADGPDELRMSSGEVYAIWGSNNMPTTIDLAFGEEDLLIYGAESGHQLSLDGSLKSGDIDGDGIADLLLGSPLASRPSNNSQQFDVYGVGMVYALFVTKAAPPIRIRELIVEVEGLGLSSNTASTLITKLNLVLDSLTSGHYQAAVGQLGSFIRQVTAFVNNAKVEEQDGELLLLEASGVVEDLLDVLGV